MEIFESSPKIKEVPKKFGKEGKYPWKELKIGQSFAINDKASITLISLRSLAYKTGERIKVKFRVIEHENCYEVGRVK